MVKYVIKVDTQSHRGVALTATESAERAAELAKVLLVCKFVTSVSISVAEVKREEAEATRG